MDKDERIAQLSHELAATKFALGIARVIMAQDQDEIGRHLREIAALKRGEPFEPQPHASAPIMAAIAVHQAAGQR
jgi:hypothetical protein